MCYLKNSLYHPACPPISQAALGTPQYNHTAILNGGSEIGFRFVSLSHPFLINVRVNKALTENTELWLCGISALNTVIIKSSVSPSWKGFFLIRSRMKCHLGFDKYYIKQPIPFGAIVSTDRWIVCHSYPERGEAFQVTRVIA